MTENEMRCAPDPGRFILRIGGEDRSGFIQGLVSNDIRRLAASGIVYAALLNPQGKYLADFFLVEAGESILIDLPAALGPGIEQRLALYRLRARVGIERAAIAVTRGLGPAPQGALPDPRHPALGWRLYGQALSCGAPIDWDALRVEALVPEAGAELIPGESYILEMGFERLNGVDFRKGCYVGQEVTARMHHKTELRKGLVRLRLEGVARPGDEIVTEEGRPAGILHTVAGDRALGYLRFDRAEGALRAGSARLWRDA